MTTDSQIHRRGALPAVLLTLGAAGAVAALAALAVLVFIAKPAYPTPPDYRVVSVGGLQYESMLGRQVHPRDAVDSVIVAGLPARERRLKNGQILFGAFIAVANGSTRSVPPARRIELRDDAGRVYRPLALPASNPYAYVPTLVPPRTRIPGFGSPADDNLAATGKLLLFRIPAETYDDGVLQLTIHDARDPRKAASLVV